MTWKRGTIVALIALGVAFAVLRLTPSDDFVFLPNKARLVAPLVIVPMLDVLLGDDVRRFTIDGSAKFAEMMVEVTKRFNLTEKNVMLKFKDDEGGTGQRLSFCVSDFTVASLCARYPVEAHRIAALSVLLSPAV